MTQQMDTLLLQNHYDLVANKLVGKDVSYEMIMCLWPFNIEKQMGISFENYDDPPIFDIEMDEDMQMRHANKYVNAGFFLHDFDLILYTFALCIILILFFLNLHFAWILICFCVLW